MALYDVLVTYVPSFSLGMIFKDFNTIPCCGRYYILRPHFSMVYVFRTYSDGICFYLFLATLSFRVRCVRKMFVTTTLLISCLSAWKRATPYLEFLPKFVHNGPKITYTSYEDILSL